MMFAIKFGSWSINYGLFKIDDMNKEINTLIKKLEKRAKAPNQRNGEEERSSKKIKCSHFYYTSTLVSRKNTFYSQNDFSHM